MLDFGNKKLLYLGQYNLDVLDSAPKIRTWQLYQELKALVDVDFITGLRNERRWPLFKYLLSGKLNQVDAIYLEAATSTSMEVDIVLLLIAWFKKIPIGIYIRDAHPMFGMIDTKTIKNKILVLGWYTSIWFYKKFAKVLFFPSLSFAKLFIANPSTDNVLPPGGRNLPFQDLNLEQINLIYAGGLSSLYGGLESVFEAMETILVKYPQVKIICICRKNELHFIKKWLEQPWLVIKNLEYDNLIELQNEMYIGLIPLAKTAYADLALPVKLFDYLSLGKPVITTDNLEMANFVNQHNVGISVPCDRDSFESAILNLLKNPELAQNMALNAIQVIQASNTWKHRAEKILNNLIPKKQSSYSK